MDPVSLTLTIGPLLIKAAKIVQQCQDVQSKIQSAPTTLASIITECNGVNHVLLEVQNLGLRDMSYIDEERRTRFINEMDNISVGCTNTLSSIEKHIEQFQADAVIVGPMRRLGLRDKVKVASIDDEVQKLLEKLRGYQMTLTTSLSLIHIQMDRNMHQLVQMQGTALTLLLERSRTHGNRNRSNQGENESSRFSVASSSNSSISDTSFEFDPEALNTAIYRQAFRKQELKNLVSRPLLPPQTVDNTSLQAVASLSEDDSYYEYSLKLSSEVSSMESSDAETIRELDLGVSLHEDFDYALPLSFVRDEETSSDSTESRGAATILPAASGTNPVEKKHSRKISNPTNLEHTTHVTLDAETGKYVGLPPEWSRIIEDYGNKKKTPEINVTEIERDADSSDGKQAEQSLIPGDLGLGVPTTPGTSNQNWKAHPVRRQWNFAGSQRSKPYSKLADIKLVVVGDNSTIKRNMLITYTTNKHPSEYVPTVFDNYAVTVLIGDDPYTLGMFDTSGQENYDRLRPLSYPQTDVFVIAASIDCEAEFENAREKWAPELHYHCPGVPVLLVGVKDSDQLWDRREEGGFHLGERKELGTSLASEIGLVGYFECDLTTQEGLKNVFDEAIVAALEPPLVKKKKKRRLSVWPRLAAKNMALIKEE